MSRLPLGMYRRWAQNRLAVPMTCHLGVDTGADGNAAPVGILVLLQASATDKNVFAEPDAVRLAALPQPRRVVVDLTRLDLTAENRCMVLMAVRLFLKGAQSQGGLDGKALLAVVCEAHVAQSLRVKRFDQFARIFELTAHPTGADVFLRTVQAALAVRDAGDGWPCM